VWQIEGGCKAGRAELCKVVEVEQRKGNGGSPQGSEAVTRRVRDGGQEKEAVRTPLQWKKGLVRTFLHNCGLAQRISEKCPHPKLAASWFGLEKISSSSASFQERLLSALRWR
jgi:hypothetical protein